MAFSLSDRQRFDWLRLIRTDRVGPRTFRGLINRFGGAGEALAALPELSRAAGQRVTPPGEAEIEREMALARRLGCRFVALGESDYPVTLAATHQAPPLLCVRGDAGALGKPMVAIVGSRNASGPGMTFAERLAAGLSQAGIVVVSGLARGIDAAAHRASLNGGTVAVLAGGQGRIYPPQHADLVEQIVATGAVVSESPFELEPRAKDFPRRNRIVAGLSLATIVVEAARASGSLITARMAMEEGREVFAVPGSPLDPRAAGTNDLLRGTGDGSRARICLSAEDVISEIAPMIEAGARPRQGDLFDDGARGPTDPLFDELDWLDLGHRPRHSGAARVDGLDEPAGDIDLSGDPDERVFTLLGATPLDIDDLARLAQLPARRVQAALVDLEMQGRALRDASGGYRRA